MPNRMLRDFTSSEKVDQLSPDAEVFFIRLMMKADDHGAFYGNPKLLKANLFPLKEISSDRMIEFIDECVKANLLIHYESEGKRFVEIVEFGQRLRQKTRKFPAPEDGEEINSRTNDRTPPLEEKRREEEEEEKKKGETSGVGKFEILTSGFISTCFFFDDR